MASFASSATTGGARKHAWTKMDKWKWKSDDSRGGADMSFCIGPLEMVIWVVFDQKIVSINFLCAKTPRTGGLKIGRPRGGDQNICCL